MYVVSFVSLQRVRRADHRFESSFLMDAGLGIQIGLIGFGVSVLFLSAHFLKMFWFMVFVSASMPALLARAVGVERARLRLGCDLHPPSETCRETVGDGLQFQLGD